MIFGIKSSEDRTNLFRVNAKTKAAVVVFFNNSFEQIYTAKN